jgi:hypothetical protein
MNRNFCLKRVSHAIFAGVPYRKISIEKLVTGYNRSGVVPVSDEIPIVWRFIESDHDAVCWGPILGIMSTPRPHSYQNGEKQQHAKHREPDNTNQYAHTLLCRTVPVSEPAK